MTPFDFTKAILQTKTYNMNEENEEEYVPWVANRALSVYPDTLFHAQEMNLYPHMTKRMQYDYLFHAIRPAKRPFVQYPKNKGGDNMSLIMEAYGYSPEKAREALSILTDEQIEEIRKMYVKGG